LPRDSDAAQFSADLALVTEVSEYLLNRFSKSDPSERESIREQLLSIIHRWDEMSRILEPRLCYSQSSFTRSRPLLIPFNPDDDENWEGFETAYQMRNVEGQAGAFITR